MKRKRNILAAIVSVLLVVIALAPFVVIFIGSFFVNGSFSVEAIYEVYFATPDYLLKFWKSAGLCAVILAGHIVVSVMGGYAFAKFQFRGKKVLFFFLILLMVLPLQVTLVPNYIVLDNMGLLDTYWALILPALFAPLGTFVLTQCFKSVPDNILEAALLDGCGSASALVRIMIPMNKSGLVCTILLALLDSWNMVEQPVTYLKDASRYPISVSLASTFSTVPAVQYACCFLVLLLPLVLFLCFSEELVEGITLGEVK